MEGTLSDLFIIGRSLWSFTAMFVPVCIGMSFIALLAVFLVDLYRAFDQLFTCMDEMEEIDG